MQKNSDPTQFENETAAPVKVGMKEWAKSDANSPVLETHGLGPCIGIATYDPTTRTGHLAHVAIPLFEQESLDGFLQSAITTASDVRDLKVWVRGGQRDPKMAETFDMPQMGRDMIAARLAALQLPEQNLDIQWDESDMGTRGTSISLDTLSGTFETSIAITEQGLLKLGDIAVTN